MKRRHREEEMWMVGWKSVYSGSENPAQIKKR